MSTSICQIRLFVVKNDDSNYEVLSHELSLNKLKCSDIIKKEEIEKNNNDVNVKWKLQFNEEKIVCDAEEAIGYEIDSIGYDGIQEDIEKILENYKSNDIIEIFGDYKVNYFYSSSYYSGEEWDSETHLENIQHTKMSDKEIERYIGTFEKDEDGFINFKQHDLVAD